MMFKFKSLSIAALSMSIILNSAGVLNAAGETLIPPSNNNLGTSIGSVQVTSDKEVTLNYTGEAQNLINISDYYKGRGTIMYRLGETGTFSPTVPMALKEGKYDVYYYITGDTNYTGSESDPNHLVVNIVKKESSENAQDSGDSQSSGSSSSDIPMNINYSVSADGTTSAIVDKKGVIWLREESEGTGAWYGLDNTNGVFEIGSRFHVKWLKEGDEEYADYFKQIDDVYKKKAEANKIEIFLVGVTKPDGKTEYKNFYEETGKIAGLYVQLGDDWDPNDINGLFITKDNDKLVAVQYASASKFTDIYGEGFPEAGMYARLTLTHYSPYAVVGAKKSSSSTSSLSSLSPYYNALSTKTGEDYSSILYLSLMSSISLMYVLISRKRKIRD